MQENELIELFKSGVVTECMVSKVLSSNKWTAIIKTSGSHDYELTGSNGNIREFDTFDSVIACLDTIGLNNATVIW